LIDVLKGAVRQSGPAERWNVINETAKFRVSRNLDSRGSHWAPRPAGKPETGQVALPNYTFANLQQREEHWAIVDLVGKAGYIRTVPIPDWVHLERAAWLSSASIERGKVFRRVSRMGRVFGEGISEKAIWHVVKFSASKAGIPALAPHDLRRTCARLCRSAGGELDQIQLLLGHVSIQTTEQYLGSRQRIRSAINDRIGIEPIVTTVDFGVLSMIRNRSSLSGESCFSPENHDCSLSERSVRRLRELFERHFRRKG